MVWPKLVRKTLVWSFKLWFTYVDVGITAIDFGKSGSSLHYATAMVALSDGNQGI